MTSAPLFLAHCQQSNLRSRWTAIKWEDILTNGLGFGGVCVQMLTSDPIYTGKHTNTKPDTSPEVGQCLLVCLMSHFCSAGWREMRRLGKIVLSSAPWSCLETFRTRSDLIVMLLLLFCLPFQRLKSSIVTLTPVLSAPHCMTSLELPGRYLSITIYCVREGGELACVSSVTLLFLQWKLFQFVLEDAAAAAVAERGTWLPARLWLHWGHYCFILEGGCAAVGAGGGGRLTHLHSVSHENRNFRQFRIQ